MPRPDNSNQEDDSRFPPMDDPAEASLQPTRHRSLANRHLMSFLADGQDAVAAIMKRSVNGRIVLVGTGFFVAERLLGTAKHVFCGDDVAEDDEFEVFQKIGTEISIRQIVQIVESPEYDAAIVELTDPGDDFRYADSHPVVATMELDPQTHEVVGTFNVSHTLVGSIQEHPTEPGEQAQRVNFRSHWELGTVEDVVDEPRPGYAGRFIQSSAFVEGRGSGGPLFNSNGFVVGLNSYGLTPGRDEEIAPYSFAQSIKHLLDLEIDGRTLRDVRRELGRTRPIATLTPNGRQNLHD